MQDPVLGEKKMTKRNIITGKDVFYDTLEKVFYVYVGNERQAVSDLSEIAYLSWTHADIEDRREFMKRHFDVTKYDEFIITSMYQDLPKEVQAKILEYQQEKAKVIPA